MRLPLEIYIFYLFIYIQSFNQSMSAPPCPLAESHLPLCPDAISAKNDFSFCTGSFRDLLSKTFEPDLSSIRLKKKAKKG